MARKRFMFWLDDKRDEDWEIKALIDDLKRDRLFSRAIREGLKMWVDAQTSEGAPAASKSGGGAGELDLDKLAAEIADRLAMTVGSQYKMQPAAPATTGKLLGGGKVLSAPVDDDEPLPDIVTRKDSGAGLKSCNNFMKGLHSLQSLQ